MDELTEIYIVVVISLIIAILIVYLRSRKGFIQKILNLKDERDRLMKENTALKSKISELSEKSYEYENLATNLKRIILQFEAISQKNYSDFFQNLLDLAISCVPEAKAGSISTIDGKRWKFMAIHGSGKNIEKLKALDLKSDWIILTPKVSIIEDIAKANEKHVPQEYSQIIEEVVGGHIYRSLVFPLRIGEDLIGNCFLDALEDIRFSENSKEMADLLSHLFSTLLTMRSLEMLPEITINNAIRNIVNFYEMKNPTTRGHSENVAYLAVRIGEKMKLSPREIGDLYWASIFHDIGLIAIPEKILEKPTKLTDEEFEIM